MKIMCSKPICPICGLIVSDKDFIEIKNQLNNGSCDNLIQECERCDAEYTVTIGKVEIPVFEVEIEPWNIQTTEKQNR